MCVMFNYQIQDKAIYFKTSCHSDDELISYISSQHLAAIERIDFTPLSSYTHSVFIVNMWGAGVKREKLFISWHRSGVNSTGIVRQVALAHVSLHDRWASKWNDPNRYNYIFHVRDIDFPSQVCLTDAVELVVQIGNRIYNKLPA